MPHLKHCVLIVYIILGSQLIAQNYIRVDSLSIYFARNSAKVKDVGALQVFLSKHRDTSQVLQICSYTDTVGGLAANIALGNARQYAVRHKIDSLDGCYKELQGKNFHESPFADDKKTNLAQQRRVDIVVMKLPTPLPPPLAKTAGGLKFELDKPINLNILFQNASAIMLPQSIKVVNQLYETLRSNPTLQVQLNGHVCCMAEMRLSLQRAEAVRDKLVAMGIAANRIKCKGFSNTQPLVPDNTPENQQKNRRVEAILTRM